MAYRKKGDSALFFRFNRPKKRALSPFLGFTLIEVLVAVVIISVGALVIHQGFSRCLHAIKRSEEVLASSMFLENSAVRLQLDAWGGKEAGTAEETKDEDGYKLLKNSAPFDALHASLALYDLTMKGPTGSIAHCSLLVHLHEETDAAS